MTLLDHLARLEALAAAAPRGPWEMERDAENGGTVLRVNSAHPDDGGFTIARITPILHMSALPWTHELMSEEMQQINASSAAFIAALDPDTVRGLIAVVRAAQAAVAADAAGIEVLVDRRMGDLEEALAKLEEMGKGAP